MLVCDRYVASSIAYGEAQGLDPAWLAEVQRFLPTADLTIMLDIPPEAAARRKVIERDRFERDLKLLSRARDSYHRQARQTDWVVIDGDRLKNEIADDVANHVTSRLELP